MTISVRIVLHDRILPHVAFAHAQYIPRFLPLKIGLLITAFNSLILECAELQIVIQYLIFIMEGNLELTDSKKQ